MMTMPVVVVNKSFASGRETGVFEHRQNSLNMRKESQMNVYHFEVEIHVHATAMPGNSSKEEWPDSLHAEVHAPSEHLARRRIMDDVLGRGLFVKKIENSGSVEQ